MTHLDRRTFLEDVGRGMLIASVGPALACELGLAPALSGEEPKALSFGDLEPLVVLLQETPPARLLPLLVEKLKKGTELRTLISAAAFANARTFGGENYFGFHVFMALAPAYHMARELPKERQALPVLKVIYRNAHYSQEVGGRAKEVLHPVEPAELPKEGADELLRKAVNRGDRAEADRILAALVRRSPEDAFNALLLGVEDNNDVHSVVLPWRAWAMLEFVGRDHALTLLRQSVHKCGKDRAGSRIKAEDHERACAWLPKLMEKHHLLAGPTGKRRAEDSWVEKLSQTLLTSAPQGAAEAVAAALGEGFSAEDVGEAISVAATQMVLRQVEVWPRHYGRRVHGDSPGVHASDATNAWRNIVRVSNARNRAAGLIVAAADLVSNCRWMDGDKALAKSAFPRPEDVEAVKVKTKEGLLKELDGAIRENNQLGACALVQRYGALGYDARGVFEVLLRYNVSEDGRLHAEKYYRTVSEEFAAARAAFRWQHLVGLARVTASAYGYNQSDSKAGRAPGYEEACRLLGV